MCDTPSVKFESKRHKTVRFIRIGCLHWPTPCLLYIFPRKRVADESLSFADGQSIHEAFQQISTARLRSICQRCIAEVREKARWELYMLIAQTPTPTQQSIRQMVIKATEQGEQRYDRRVLSEETNQATISLSEQGQPQDAFMRAPSKEVIDSLIRDFIDRTSNSALATGVCAVCARETSRKELTAHQLDLIPSPHRLQPMAPHPRHHILNGMLLQPAGLTTEGSANVCVECFRALSSDKIPAFALANGLWIGEIPHELAYLTLPERLLIAKYFPAAYIIKLYPKKKGARHWDKRQLYSGLKGNVSTYQLDQKQIASMVDGTIMPQQSRVLAATIGITFVGPKNLPDRGLPDLFKVRRIRVQRALEWLKENNPLFSDITISASRLAELPENDVPYELRATTKLSSDTSALYAEQDGYVPSQDADDGVSEGG